MEFGRSIIIGVGKNDYREPPASLHLFAEVVLINKEADGVHPLLYQLQSDAINHQSLFDEPYTRLHLPETAFMLIGSVILVNKKEKQILIKDKNNLSHEKTVSYKHLIISSKKRPGTGEQDQFEVALHALIEAQRVRKKSEALIAGKDPGAGQRSAKELLSKLLNKAKKQKSTNLQGLAPKFSQDQKNASILTPDNLYEVQL